MKRKFKFAKPKLVSINGNPVNIEYSWMIVLESIEDLLDYNEIYQASEIKDSLRELITKNYAMHNTFNWGYLVELISSLKGESIIKTSCNLELEVFNSRMQCILQSGKMYLNTNGAGFPHSKDIEIVEEIEKEGWPEYSKKDIKIIQWPNGKHFYAKIGKLDVVIDGIQKWDTYEEAKIAANNYFEEINN
jgi:hypothetical protein